MRETAVANVHGDVERQQNERQFKRMLIVLAVLTGIAALLIVGSLLWRSPTQMNNPRERTSQIITIAVTLVWGAAAIFLWDMKMAPQVSYRRYLREIYAGLSRDVEGTVARVDAETTFRDGLSFYGVVINVGDIEEPEDERQLYWDARLGLPPFTEGDKAFVRAHGNDIIGLRRP